MGNVEEFELTKKQRIAGNLTAGVVIILCGIFLLLCGTGVIPLNIKKVLAAGILLSFGTVFLVTGLIQKNNVSIWLCFPFLVSALVEILAKAANQSYAGLYPMYIAIPAVASLFTMLYSKSWKSHIGVIAVFGLVSVIFSLQSSGAAPWAVVVPVLIVALGLGIVFFAIRKANSEKPEPEDAPAEGDK